MFNVCGKIGRFADTTKQRGVMGNQASRANRAKHDGVAFQFVLAGVLTSPQKIPKISKMECSCRI